MPRLMPAVIASSLAWAASSMLSGCATPTKYVAAPCEPPARPPASLLQKPEPISYRPEFEKALSNWLGSSAAASPSTTSSPH